MSVVRLFPELPACEPDTSYVSVVGPDGCEAFGLWINPDPELCRCLMPGVGPQQDFVVKALMDALAMFASRT